MSIRIVQLGSPRKRGEGLRIGTVRRPPRGLPKRLYQEYDVFDVWLPNLAPSAELMRRTFDGPQDLAGWKRFDRSYRREMSRPESKHLIETLAALSHQTNFSVGCYCAAEGYHPPESTCHRFILAELLREAGADVR